jgi:hypothetical protein
MSAILTQFFQGLLKSSFLKKSHKNTDVLVVTQTTGPAEVP